MLATKATSSPLSVLTACSILSLLPSTFAQGIVDNADAAKKFLAAATPISGSYRVTAQDSGNSFIYSWFNKNEIFISEKSPDNLLDEIASDIAHAIALDTWTFTPNSNGDGSTSMCIESECKCIASQWDFGEAPNSTVGGGFDHFGVASPAVVSTVGSTNCPNPGTGMTPDKQHWVFMKVDNSSSSDDSSSKRDLHHRRSLNHGQRMEKQFKRDEDYSGDYVVLAYDHLTDMATKMLTGQNLLSFDSLNSAGLADYDPESPVIITLTKADW